MGPVPQHVLQLTVQSLIACADPEGDLNFIEYET